MLKSTSARILLAMLFGVLYAIIAVHYGWIQFTNDWIAPLGTAFLSILKLLAVPLVLVSVITGIASLPDPRHLGRLGGKTLVAYLLTTILAIGLGCGLTLLVNPAQTLGETQIAENRLRYERWAESQQLPTVDGQYWSQRPENATLMAKVEASSLQAYTVADVQQKDSIGFREDGTGVLRTGFLLQEGGYTLVRDGQTLAAKGSYQLGDELSVAQDAAFITWKINGTLIHREEIAKGLAETLEKKSNRKDKTGLGYLVDILVPDNIFVALGDIKSLLKVIFFGMLLGMALLFVPTEQAQPLLRLCDSLNATLLLLIEWVMRLAPLFVFALMAGTIVSVAGSLRELVNILLSLLAFSLTALAGLLLLTYVLYPAILSGITRRWQFRDFFQKILPAQSMAFSTSSSAGTLPVTLRCVTEHLKVPPAIANFVLPIGSTVNMDGTSLYQSVCILFLAHWHGISFEASDLVLMGALITLSSIGSAAVPSGGLVLMMVVMESMGLDAAWVGIILPMDRLLDMFRTVTNVTGDALVAKVIAHSES
ncbi:MAG: dicarboxylate/amino acid:cation symporter [Lewinellaceae bacterium]|nr:dicarboxylate/amino acid:cation symporter [Phaeodactylibacter sp.]MCB9347514.1 dicarboxylate/amino acid:cation symporter [Lewinellaceae bacterium]